MASCWCLRKRRGRSGHERQSQIPCRIQASSGGTSQGPAARKERACACWHRCCRRARTQPMVVQQRLALKSVCSQAGNSLVRVPAFQRSQVIAAHHVQVSVRWHFSVTLPACAFFSVTDDKRGGSPNKWCCFKFMTLPSKQSCSQPKTGQGCMCVCVSTLSAQNTKTTTGLDVCLILTWSPRQAFNVTVTNTVCALSQS